MGTVLFAVIVLVIVVIAVMRFKFDMDYTAPVISENKDLSVLNLVAYGAVAVMFIALLTKQYALFIISLVIGIPLLLYVNWRIYSAAIKKFFKK